MYPKNKGKNYLVPKIGKIFFFPITGENAGKIMTYFSFS